MINRAPQIYLSCFPKQQPYSLRLWQSLLRILQELLRWGEVGLCHWTGSDFKNAFCKSHTCNNRTRQNPGVFSLTSHQTRIWSSALSFHPLPIGPKQSERTRLPFPCVIWHVLRDGRGREVRANHK